MTGPSRRQSASAPPLRQRQREFREQEILRTAADLLAERGCRAFTMDELAARLSASKATLYLHFQSKDALVRTVLGECSRRVLEELPDGTDREALHRRLVHLAGACLRVGVPNGGLSVPCCLREVSCPYGTWSEVESLLTGPDPPPAGGLGPGQALRAIAAVVAARLRAEGRVPSQEDVDAVLRYIHPP